MPDPRFERNDNVAIFQHPAVSVIMPTFGQAQFIPRAIYSLLGQAFLDWELIVVDDGSPDDTREVVASFLPRPRIRYQRLTQNVGLGSALNIGLSLARAPLIAYLPSDDIYYADHLASLAARLGESDAALAFSGVRYDYDRVAHGRIDGRPMQLVQVMHRRMPDLWMERAELVTDDLDRMYWNKIRRQGGEAGTGLITCEWVSHPGQRHKLIQEPEGGVNAYRSHFRISQPLRFHSTAGNYIDEVEQYRRFRNRPATPPTPDGLKILLAGELAYNPERVLALEELGHTLYGLWMPRPFWYNTVGPVPFGHVEDVPVTGWEAAVARIRPDVIYALLNWQTVPFLHEVMRRNPGIPFVWHFKEGPFICMEKGTWPQLSELYAKADGLVHCSREMARWASCTFRRPAEVPELVLDGDLPKRDWFTSARSRRLSEADGEIHTVVPGRPIGLHPADIPALGSRGIHLHFYGDFAHGQWKEWIENGLRLAPGHLHLHSHLNADRWVTEFSKYDAGWLHLFKSANGGEILRANWDDLNVPARTSTLAAAGLPLLQWNNQGADVAVQTIAREMDIGVFFEDADDLAAQLRDSERMSRLGENVWSNRDWFTFDHHAPELIRLFREAISRKGSGRV